ncbi:glycosyltransferase [Halomonas sp. M20]|uniref:glycosyltransferase n=1 Tax=Halomonas sp. M20 TaxID=2763264 RepID=UPI001D0B0BA4|nr:glycosyltransferase [Halomonas sp. M20]
MKILHFISSPASGGAEIYVRDLCIHMARQGHSVLIIFLTDAKSIGRDIEFEKKFLNELKENGIDYKILGSRSKKDLLLNFLKVGKLLNTLKPDVVHAHLHYAMVYLSAFRSKVVYTHHSIIPGAPVFIFKLYNLRVGRYIGISKKCKEILEGYTNHEVARIDNAVDSERLNGNIKPRVESDSNTVTIVATGRLMHAKNYEMLIEVAVKLKEKNENFKILVAGEGKKEYRKILEEKVVERKVEDRFKFLGQCNDIPRLLKSADIFVTTSHYEGLPISLIEASLLGVPAVVTDVGSCGEVVEKCKSGFVVNADDVQNFSEKCSLLINDKELRLRLSKSALVLSSHYEIERSVNEHLTLYKNL